MLIRRTVRSSCSIVVTNTAVESASEITVNAATRLVLRNHICVYRLVQFYGLGVLEDVDSNRVFAQRLEEPACIHQSLQNAT